MFFFSHSNVKKIPTGLWGNGSNLTIAPNGEADPKKLSDQKLW